jgi:hypothetical protein
MKALALIALLACTGCVTARQGFYMGQGADIATTAYALDHGFAEGNPLADDMQDVLIMKATGIILFELAAHIWPDHADAIYKVGGVMGAVPAALNVYTIRSN